MKKEQGQGEETYLQEEQGKGAHQENNVRKNELATKQQEPGFGNDGQEPHYDTAELL